MGKWQPVNPADLKPGDKVKAISSGGKVSGLVEVTDSNGYVLIRFGKLFYLRSDCRDVQWFRRKPAKPTRPAEPPAGTVVRKVSTGEVGIRDCDTSAPWEVIDPSRILGAGSYSWDTWIQPGDTIEIAEWVKP